MTTLPELTDKESCLDSLRSLPPAILAEMSLSTGKSLPRDAGKFVTCNGISGAHYLLATMMGAMPMAPQTALKLGLGLCVPEACGQNDVPAILNSSALIPDLRVLTISNVHVSDPVKGLAAPGIRFGFAVAIVMILVLMIAVSTAYAWVTNRSQDSPNSRLARNSTLTQAFSLIGRSGTLTKLVELPPSKPTDCLNGLRVLAMAWIILGHSFLMPEGVSGYLNPQDVTSSPLNTASAESNPLLMIIIQAEQSVDTFFFFVRIPTLSLDAERASASRSSSIACHFASVLSPNAELGPSHVGVLWNPALFGLWSLCSHVTRFHFPAL